MLVRLLMVLGLATLFLCCSYDEHINATNMPGNESSNQALNSVDKKKIDSPVTAFGVFSNRDGNGVHEWGYEVDLWEHNGDVIGMFTGSAGTRLVGDPPTGILKDVMYNFDTGIISFRASLPNNDYEFEGVLSKKALSGRLFNMSGRLLSQRCDEAESQLSERKCSPHGWVGSQFSVLFCSHSLAWVVTPYPCSFT